LGNSDNADTIRFTHNNEEFEIIEQVNKAVQTDLDENDGINDNDKLFQQNVPRTKGVANISKGTTTEPQINRQPLPQQTTNNKQQQTNHDLTERIESKREKGGGMPKSALTSTSTIAVGNDSDQSISSKEHYYYTRPVQEQCSVAIVNTSRDSGVQACIYDMIFAETKCQPQQQQSFQNTNKCQQEKVSSPVQCNQRIVSSGCRLKTGLSTRFQPAMSNNMICPRTLPQEPSRGHLNICRQDFRTLSRCAHLTWSNVIEHTENRCTTSGNEENQQCCRRGYNNNNNYEPSLSDNCPVQRSPACRVPSGKKSWFSWW